MPVTLLSGLNFVQADVTVTGSMSCEPCVTSAWVSATSVLCMVGVNAASTYGTAGLTVSSSVGTAMVSQFTFDGTLGSGGSCLQQ